MTPVLDEGTLAPRDLGALRERLEGALEAVKAREMAATASGVREPETVDEIEALEHKLEEALADLKARKAGLGR